MFYKIREITDRLGRDKSKDNEFYQEKIGIILDMQESSFSVGRSCVMWCTKPSNFHSFITSTVVDVNRKEDEIVVTTLNSIYHLDYVLQ